MFIGGLSFGRWYRRGSDRETVHLRWLYKDRYATNIVRGTRGRWGVSERFTILRRAVLESIVLVGIPAGAIAIILDSQGWLLSYLSGFGLICLVSFGIIATVRFDQCFGEAPIFGVSSDVDQGADVAIGPKGGPNVPRMTLPT
ncbi:MAG TPA: hypothetical protein VN420_05010 [Candidatus Fimivivens sp.]|nr:hypothetical protein [Candidatus Fimivivens sp.]